MFIHAITYIYDKHTDIVFNAGNQMVKAKNILIDNIEAAFNGCSDTLHKCSSINNAAPPEKRTLQNAKSFFQRNESLRYVKLPCGQ